MIGKQISRINDTITKNDRIFSILLSFMLLSLVLHTVERLKNMPESMHNTWSSGLGVEQKFSLWIRPCMKFVLVKQTS